MLRLLIRVRIATCVLVQSRQIYFQMLIRARLARREQFRVVLLQPFAEKQNFPIRPIKRGSCVSLCNPRPSIFSMAYGWARRTCIRVLTGREREIGGLTTANKRRGAGRGLSNALAEGVEFLIARQIQSPDTDNTNPSPENSAGSFKRCYFRADDTSPQTLALPRSKRILNPYS